MSPDKRLSELDLALPPPFQPTGRYRTVMVVGPMVYLAGHGPLTDEGKFLVGKVGADLDYDRARAAARQTGLSLVSTIRNHFGSLDVVSRVIKTLGMVNCVDTFGNTPGVIDGCSDLFADLFGAENGVGARSAVGMSSLPFGIPVEIEMILELHNQSAADR